MMATLPIAWSTLVTSAHAQDYPSRLIRIILPFPPSGATDVYARLMARELQALWGQPVIVENRTGATGLIGTDLAKRAAADGYTLLFTSNTAHILGPLPREPRPFDPAGDFAPITKLLRYPLYLLDEHDWARKIGPLMSPDQNSSPSFGKFRAGLLRLIS